MLIKTLTKEQLREIYHSYLERDFNPAEIKPLASIEALYDQGLYDCHGFYEEDQLMAYALLCHYPQGQIPLLDYLAVMPEQRSKGLGGIFLQALAQQYQDQPGLMLEVENPAFFLDATDQKLKQRRVDFYVRQGVIKTTVRCRLFGIEMLLMYLPLKKSANDTQIRQELLNIYRHSSASHVESGKIIVY
ncbi:MAG: GNAT family N-acetyltransferase [Clostridiales bacterium]